ncbi:phage Gp37/Gp68 family protein [Spongiibacter sp. KMU-158]|uniref:Phage Gp37/Gp68 family protein n=1 Tax=Spongiibacter pelagi TaxID=2760804 RepID=A0A927GYC8_9GAMM|nr:phage Gp37/Gp68 family protein [Spongiibacter pelagi]MBD2860314.1 phage Gp37/Gp68 family protein [Spongiibacter pelagi]
MSKIEWTEQTWNPVTGCTKVSPGCKHCYAETMSRRLQAMGAVGYENGFGLSLLPERLSQPLKRKKPTIYFVNSMSDLFQEDVPYGFIDEVMGVIRQTPQHTYQILTKRSQNMRRYFEDRKVPFNAWLGVSVEDKKYGKPRIGDLQAIRASTRFLSVEPLLEDLGRLNLKGIAWVIVGGESGAKARPMKESWAMNVKSQCERSGTDFFFKQWGSWGADGVRRSKQANGRALAGKTWDSIPLVNI